MESLKIFNPKESKKGGKKGQRSNEIKTQQTQDDSYLNTICYLVIPRIDNGL